jgi:hypothetical protein
MFNDELIEPTSQIPEALEGEGNMVDDFCVIINLLSSINKKLSHIF